MRITRIDIQGDDPQNHARMRRHQGSDRVEIEILTPTKTTQHSFAARDENALWDAARLIQAILDGRRGTAGDIYDYQQALERLAD